MYIHSVLFGTVDTKLHILLAYAEDIDVVGRTQHDGKWEQDKDDAGKATTKKGTIAATENCNIEVAI